MELSLEYIRQLATGNEGVDVEFKETTGQLNRGMETLCGMINGHGGVVVFGVSNKGKISGQEIADKTTREIGEALNKFDPAIDIQPDYIPLDDSDKYIIVFRSDGLETDKPYLWDGKPYQRYDSVTSVMPREKFIRLHELQHGLKYKWENEVNHKFALDALDEQLILNVIQSAVRRGRLPNSALNDNVPTALKRLRLVKDGGICNSAAVLFGKDFTDYPQCTLRLARFRGTTKQDFIDNQQQEGNIFQLVDAAMSFFFKHLNLSGTTNHCIVREDELEIPYNALRESVVNAYCHMNWGYVTATVGIAIYDDRIEIENAGRFPARISPNILMQEEEEHRENTSLPPNPVIANVMYLGGLIEHWGRGLSLMARECERASLRVPEFYINGSLVRITFARPNDASRNPAEPSSELCKDTSKDTSKDTTKDTSSSTSSIAYEEHLKETTYSESCIKLIKIIGEDWSTLYDMLDITGYKSRPTFIKNHLRPAIGLGLIVFQNPDKPNAPNQKYGLTVKGKAIYYGRKDIILDPQNDPQTNLEGHADPQNTDPDPLKETIIRAIKQNVGISRAELASIAGCSESTVKRRLKDWDIAWVGHPRTGHWAFIRDIQ